MNDRLNSRQCSRECDSEKRFLVSLVSTFRRRRSFETRTCVSSVPCGRVFLSEFVSSLKGNRRIRNTPFEGAKRRYVVRRISVYVCREFSRTSFSPRRLEGGELDGSSPFRGRRWKGPYRFDAFPELVSRSLDDGDLFAVDDDL